MLPSFEEHYSARMWLLDWSTNCAHVSIEEHYCAWSVLPNFDTLNLRFGMVCAWTKYVWEVVGGRCW